MPKINKSSLITIGVFLAVFAVGFIEINILLLPWYLVLLTYAAIAAVALLSARVKIIVMLGTLAYNRGDEKKAAERFERAIAKGTKQSGVFIGRASIALRAGEPEIAREMCEQCAKLKLDVFGEKNLKITQAAVKWTSGDIDGAIEILEKMRADYEYVNDSVLTTLGYLYITKRNLEKARELTELALADNPSSYAALDNMGQIYYYMEDYMKAEEEFTQALAIKGDYVDSLYFMGLIYESRGDAERARECFINAGKARVTPMNAVTAAMITEKVGAYDSRVCGILQ